MTPSLDSWILAARPPTLWAAVAPVLVGSALAARAEVFRTDAAVVALVAAVLIQIGVNFANDVADGTRGTDENRIGPKRAVASGLITARQMWVGIAWAFGLAAVAGLYLIKLGGPWILVIGIVSIIAALGYTNGPIPYGYYGLGEIFVFVFFGLVATAGTRYVFDRSIETGTWVGGVSMGLLASAILLANNVRDIDTDRESGKRTLAVILGRRPSVVFYALCIVGSILVPVFGVAVDWLPPGALLILAALPLGLPMIRALQRERSGPALIGVLKGTARFQIIVAVLLAFGILI
ncbi:MAG: 1,4-dihydroxy-2-naphthoate polyprenyltransferase [Acidimicrobiia bacterium]|nr:1,4-dihydroxy-2-naphthoate polyprenyltransferase [Acidimicrobiia bacterium]MDX2467097.1 1,4-dihydroxy-2-naphthoate polyprenyltransferase [Acidimicrobiia bacterium]